MPTGHVVDIYSKFDVIVSFVCLYLLFETRTLDIVQVNTLIVNPTMQVIMWTR